MATTSHDSMVGKAQRGCLVIGDVTGYTEYLQDTELEHAQDVLADLIETVVDRLAPTLRLSKLEGDAAFAYAPEEEIEPSMLLDTIEESYFAFRARVRDIRQATTCECNACLLIPNLDLKFVVHHGRFVRQRVAGSEELAGSDVILVHRLLKNTVSERFQVRGYALFTQECMDAMGMEPLAMGLQEHRESHEDAGEVVGYVEDLEARWRYEDERRRVFVVPSEAEFEEAVTVPGPAPVVWEYLTSPQKRPLWQGGVSRIDEEAPGGRRGVGTTNHCVHGRSAVTQEFLDWRPFRYFTLRNDAPMIGWWTWTIELRPTEDGNTDVVTRAERLQGAKKRMVWALIRKRVVAQEKADAQRLRSLLEEHTQEWALASSA